MIARKTFHDLPKEIIVSVAAKAANVMTRLFASSLAYLSAEQKLFRKVQKELIVKPDNNNLAK